MQPAMQSPEPMVTFTELPDGRTYCVTNRPTADGGWVATHQDVTECLGGAEEVLDAHLGDRYQALCDPRLNARQSLAIHWGTFDNLTDESLYEPPSRLAAERAKAGLSEDQFFVLKHGETRSLEKAMRRD